MSSALDIQRERASAIARELVERAPAGSIACIFAGGSLGRGEVWASLVDGNLEVYSDVDLYVVADPPSIGGVRNAARTLPALTREGVRFLRAADIGVYTQRDLAAQPVRPGTAELDARHVLLYGDERIPRALSGREAAKIPTEEALYLLENRAMELSAAHDTSRASLALALKARLDVYSAHAIVSGTFDATLAARAERLSARHPRRLAPMRAKMSPMRSTRRATSAHGCALTTRARNVGAP